MEKEFEVAKLRRLRRRADYPLRLFLSAIGRLHWVEEGTDGTARGDRHPMMDCSATTLGWRTAAGGCPYCGRNGSGGRGGRAGAR